MRAYEIGGDGYEVLVGNDRYDTVAYAGLCRAIEMAQWAASARRASIHWFSFSGCYRHAKTVQAAK